VLLHGAGKHDEGLPKGVWPWRGKSMEKRGEMASTMTDEEEGGKVGRDQDSSGAPSQNERKGKEAETWEGGLDRS